MPSSIQMPSVFSIRRWIISMVVGSVLGGLSAIWVSTGLSESLLRQLVHSDVNPSAMRGFGVYGPAVAGLWAAIVVSSIVQSSALSGTNCDARKWIIAGITGALFSFAVSLYAVNLGLWGLSNQLRPNGLVLQLAITVVPFATVICIWLLQLRELNRHFDNALTWLWTNALGWGLGIVSAIALGLILVSNLSPALLRYLSYEGSSLLILALCTIILGAISGVTTGSSLKRITTSRRLGH